MKTFASVSAYITAAPPAVRTRLRQLRAAIKKAAPQAEESIAYSMPAYKLAGRPLVYFAAFTGHVGFYGTPALNAHFAKELARFKTGRGSIQFPHDAPLPLRLVERMVKYRVADNLARARPKQTRQPRKTSQPASRRQR
jgi:uncharacterized protein YdhG (YjbR/CyaY superfamily)